MEMEAITKEPERYVAEGEGTSATQEAKSEGEAETELYTKLKGPTEDLYSEAKFLTDPSKTKIGGFLGLQDARLWRGVSVSLGATCAVLILIIVLLVIKLQSGPVCQGAPAKFVSSKSLTVNVSHKCCQADRCTNGWLRHGDSCFFLSTLRKTWDEAQKNCSDEGGNLAVIASHSVQNFLIQNGNLPYWIGLRYDQSSWTWVDRRPLTQSYWSDTPYKGNCVLLKGNASRDKSWMRSSCTRPTYYICELPAPKN